MVKQKIGIREVAARAGVSVSAVSQVLNGKGRISEATRNKVRIAADELDFILDHSAAKLRSGQSSLIGVIVNDFSNPVFTELTAGLETEAFANGYLTVLANSNEDLHRQEELIETMIGQGVGGFAIVPAVGSTPETFKPIQARSLPYIICARDIQDENADYIGVDDFQCGVLASTHLVELGHKNIAFIGGYPELVTFRRRMAGFRKVMGNHGLSVYEELVIPGPSTLEFGSEMAEQLNKNSQNFSAIICYSDIIAVGFCAKLRTAERQIADDISVVGVDNLPESKAIYPALTTVDHHPREVGRRAAEALNRTLKNNKTSKERVFLPVQLIIRNSTANV